MTGQNKSPALQVTSAKTEGETGLGLGGKYLTFKLMDEEYGLEILKVKQIIELMKITWVPRMPDFIKGVINLRGLIIPVVDLRKKFGLPELENTLRACIIVVLINISGRVIQMGVFVDTVLEVLEIPDENIDPPPELGAYVDTKFVLGLGKVQGTVKILLDINKLLTKDELEIVKDSKTNLIENDREKKVNKKEKDNIKNNLKS